MPDHPQIGYVGLGNIGLPMAVNISEYIKLNNLPPLAVWNRSADKYAKVPDCVGVDRIEELISKSDCDIIFTSYPNDEIATYLCPKLAMCIQQKGKTGVIIVDQSTLHPKTSGTPPRTHPCLFSLDADGVSLDEKVHFRPWSYLPLCACLWTTARGHLPKYGLCDLWRQRCDRHCHADS